MSRRPGREDTSQLKIDWTGARERPSSSAVPAVTAVDAPSPASVALVQHLPYDFRTSFPEPLPEAIEDDTIDGFDVTPGGLRALHEAHSAAALAALRERDRLSEARRSGVDPASGRKPSSKTGRERLRRQLSDAPERQQHAFDVMMLTYADAFGAEAADAFTKALIAWHAGVEVVADAKSRMGASNSTTRPDIDAELRAPAKARSSARRSPASLPVPKPLRSAVRSAAFGQDEHGPVNPSADEVREITQQHAEQLAGLLMGATAARSEEGLRQFEEGISAYAEDFGVEAAGRLRRYVERVAQREQRESRSRSR